VTPSRLLRLAYQRLRALTRPSEIAREIDRELAWHLDLLIQEKLAQGLSPEAARREARGEFGNLPILAERSRDVRGITWLSDAVQDARHGVRMLRRSPGLTTIASLSLAIGVGASAAVAGAMALVLARPLPFPESSRLVTFHSTRADGSVQRGGWSAADYAAWRDRSRTVGQIGASLAMPRAIGADAGGAPADRVSSQTFTPSLFRVLGVQPALGQLFGETTDPFSRTALVAVISHRLWHRRYAGTPDVLGRTIVVEGAPRRIVGVMGADFRYQDGNVDLWIPMIVVPDAEPRRAPPSGGALVVTARLRPGVAIERARADLDAIARARNPSASPVRVVPLREALYGWTKPRLMTLAGAVLLLLTLASANIASLLLARASMRRPEVAIRIALGATRGRIVRQLVTESLVLGLAAGVLGVAVAAVSVPAVTAVLGPPPGLPRLDALRLDGWILVAVGLFATVSSVAFGLVPALAEGRGDLRAALTPLARAGGGHPSRGRARAVLVSAQLALAEVLLIGATLLGVSFLRMTGRELHIDPRGLLTFDYAIRAGQFARPLGAENGVPSFDVSPRGSQTIHRIYERLRAVDPAGAVAGISFPPVNSLVLPTIGVRPLDGGRPRSSETLAAYFLVTPDLFATLRTPIVKGREFDRRDMRSAPWTVVVNEALARLCWPGQDPVGRHIRIEAGPDEPVREVIGVVRDVPTRLDQPVAQPVIYASYLQQPALYRGRAVVMFGSMTFVLRPSGDAAAVLAAAREAVTQVTPDSPIGSVGTLQAHLFARVSERRNYVAALGAFALIAALLAAIGLYGVLTYEVNARSGEIAVRKALGARRRDILAAIGRSSAAIVGVGLTAGFAAALALPRLLAGQLWGTAPFDPATFAGVSVGLLAVALASCVIPLNRALAVDLAARLRSD
jgi:putative ABC transport system permease protein